MYIKYLTLITLIFSYGAFSHAKDLVISTSLTTSGKCLSGCVLMEIKNKGVENLTLKYPEEESERLTLLIYDENMIRMDKRVSSKPAYLSKAEGDIHNKRSIP